MDVTIDTVSAQIQREAEEETSRSEAQPRLRELTESERPDLSFMTRRERVRARLNTF